MVASAFVTNAIPRVSVTTAVSRFDLLFMLFSAC
jgi:hypothetical protein